MDIKYKLLRSQNDKIQIYSKEKEKKFEKCVLTTLTVGNPRYRGDSVKVK